MISIGDAKFQRSKMRYHPKNSFSKSWIRWKKKFALILTSICFDLLKLQVRLDLKSSLACLDVYVADDTSLIFACS